MSDPEGKDGDVPSAAEDVTDAPVVAPAPPAPPTASPPWTRSSPLEYFTLRHALAIEGKLGAGPRESLARALALGTQRAEAAETLWHGGHSAEALRLGLDALEELLRALPIYAAAIGLDVDFDADAAAARHATLRARGLRPARIAALESAIAASRGATLPVEDGEVRPVHTVLWRQLASAHHELSRALVDAARSRSQLRALSAGRVLSAVAIVAIAGVSTYFLTRTPEGVFADASGVWAEAEQYTPDKAIDGRADTMWLAPDGTQSTLDVRMSPPRTVSRVRLVNGINAPHLDRGTRDYRVEVFAGGRVVRTEEGTLPHDATPVEIGMERVDEVERIRFTARTHYRIGAGLAELQFE